MLLHWGKSGVTKNVVIIQFFTTENPSSEGFSSASRRHPALVVATTKKRGREPCWRQLRKGKKLNNHNVFCAKSDFAHAHFVHYMKTENRRRKRFLLKPFARAGKTTSSRPVLGSKIPQNYSTDRGDDGEGEKSSGIVHWNKGLWHPLLSDKAWRECRFPASASRAKLLLVA